MTEENFPRGGRVIKRSRKENEESGAIGDVDDLFAPNKKKQKTPKSSTKLQKTAVAGVWDKRLTWNLTQPGLMVLGCVRQINEIDLDIETADGVICKLSIEHISPKLAASLIERTDLSLQDLYTVGQLLPCKVIRAGQEKGKFTGRDPPLVTCDPAQVNSGLLVGALQKGLNIVATVLSHEDKGILLDIGLSSVRAFLPYTQLPEHQSRDTVIVGQTFLCPIVHVSEDRKLIKCSRIFTSDTVEDTRLIQKNDLLPGTVVQSTVERVTGTGVFVKINKGVFGYINRFHLPPKFLGSTESLLGESEITVAVTYVQPNTNMLGLTALTQVINLDKDSERTVFEDLKVGDTVEGRVLEVTSKESVYFNLSKKRKRPLLGLATRPQLQLNPQASSIELNEKYPIGSVHHCRVVGYRLLDRMVQLSTKSDVLKQKIVSLSEALPGQRLKAQVEAVKQSGVYVRVCGLRGFIPALHTADAPLLRPERNIQKGQTLSCRVLYVDKPKARLVLTRKQSLVESSLPIVSDYSTSHLNQQTVGTVVHVTESGTLVSLYGTVRGWIRNMDLRESGFESAKGNLSVGQPVCVSVFSVEPDTERMQLRLVSILHGSSSKKTDLVTCTITSVAENGLHMKLEEGGKGWIGVEHLTDTPPDKQTLTNFEEGVKIECLQMHEQAGVMQLTAKPLVLSWARMDRLAHSFEELEPGQLVLGVVSQCHPSLGYFIELPAASGLSGLASASSVARQLNERETVVGRVMSVDSERRRFSLEILPDLTAPEAGLKRKLGKVRVGKLYDGVKIVEKVSDMMLNLLFPNGFRGRLHVSELSDEFQVGSHPLEDFMSENKNKTFRVRVIGFYNAAKERKKSKASKKDLHKRVSKVRIAECTVRDSKMFDQKQKRTGIGYQDQFHNSQSLPVFVTAVKDQHVEVSITPTWRGRVPLIRVSTDPSIILNASDNFTPGQVQMGRILGVDKPHKRLELSFLPATLHTEALKPCMARVAAINDKEADWLVGFELANGQTAVAGGVELTEDYDLIDAELGKLKKGQILRVCPVKYDHKTGRWFATIRSSFLTEPAEGTKSVRDPLVTEISELHEGQSIRGFVKSAKIGAGLFVTLGCGLSGRAHFVKGSSKIHMSPEDLCSVGSLVAVTVQKIHENKIELSLEPKDIKVEKGSKPIRRRRTSSTGSLESKPIKFEHVVCPSESSDTVPKAKKIKTEQTASDPGFDWAPNEFTPAKLMDVGMEKNEQETAPKTDEKKSKKKKQKEPESEVKEVSSDACQELDRLLVGSPKSSQLWLRYMALFIDCNDVARARQTADRALKTINYREEQERLNIWIALLNLEMNYGDEQSLTDVFERAVQANDALKIHKQMLKIYQNANKVQEADEIIEQMLRKFRQEDLEIWILAGEHYYATDRPQMARQLMQRALKSAPQTKHISLISRFGQMELSSKSGDTERGKTLFESLISSYPKKTEIWNLYIDMTCKYCSTEEARSLLDRVTSLTFGTHKMRLFFKKWLEFEEKLGSEESKTDVKQRALAYVQSVEEKL